MASVVKVVVTINKTLNKTIAQPTLLEVNNHLQDGELLAVYCAHTPVKLYYLIPMISQISVQRCIPGVFVTSGYVSRLDHNW